VAYVSAGVLAAASVALFLEPSSRRKSGGLGLWLDVRASGLQVGYGGEL